jgi:hypothetical protein
MKNFGFRISDFEFSIHPPWRPVSGPQPGNFEFGSSVHEAAALITRDLNKSEIRNPKSEIGIG